MSKNGATTLRQSGNVSHWTREMASKIAQTPENTFPRFETAKVKTILDGYDVWDSWFVLNEQNEVADVMGFKVLVGLAREHNDPEPANARIMYFYSEDGVHYKAGGLLFGEQRLFADCQEWSGSTILRNDGQLQSFYTIATGYQAYGNWQTMQRFATAIQELSLSSSTSEEEVKAGVEPVITGLVAHKPHYHDIIAQPDGRLYETAEQAAFKESILPTMHRASVGSDQTENTCFRDPHFFHDKATGRKFLVFEANTGPECHQDGVVLRDYIGSKGFEDNYRPTTDALKANGCVGILELTNEEYTYGVFQKPWLTANLVTDEIERINIVEHQGHLYLFVVGHGNKNAMNAENSDLVNLDYMLGFRADRFKGKLTPLNESGVVVCQKSGGVAYGGQAENEQYVYSWLMVPTGTPGVFDCTSYSNYSTTKEGKLEPIKSAGPTVVVELNGLKSRIVSLKYDILPVVEAPVA